MFTGIVEATGVVTDILESGTNKTFWVESLISNELKVDQSVSHSGVCLTVEEVCNGQHRVTAIAETLSKTNLGEWKRGELVNLERCMVLNGRLDGHIVQGHVDTTGVCLEIKKLEGSWEYKIQFPEKFSPLIIEKGSLALNGISLTIFNISKNHFTVGIIPFTFNQTNIHCLMVNREVNIEFDVIGKYINRSLSQNEL